ncbi:cleavage and polyadenylation specificity factor subunit 2 [Mactra antiquata]
MVKLLPLSNCFAKLCSINIHIRFVVLCSEPDLESGFSRDLFVAWCGNPKNSIILTNRTSPSTLARWLIDNPDKETVTMEVRRRIRLEGSELEEYVKKKQQSKEKEAKQDREESSDESDTEMEVDSALPVAGTSKPKHDIIIKQEGKGRSGFFKQAKKSYPMFPYVEERMKWDEYGEVIRPEDYMIAEVQATDETLNTILVHGSEEATQSLAEYCNNTSGMIQGRVFTPYIGETIDATTESHIFQVRLRDYVVSALEFSKAKDTELAWINGCLDMSSNNDEVDKDIYKQDEDEEMDIDKSLKLKGGLENVPSLEAAQSNQLQGHMAVYVNEPKLSDFKMVLLQDNIQAEFSAGALVCNETIAVRRNETGRMQLEGAISKDYFKVRDLLYSQYAIV